MSLSASDLRTATTGLVPRRLRYKSFDSAASPRPSISHGYLGVVSLSEAYINDTLVNEGLHTISIKRGLVPPCS